jgi:hypothetical protein
LINFFYPFLGFNHLGLAVDGPYGLLLLSNFYNQVTDKHPNITDLVSLTLDLTVPTVLGSNFNTHSKIWSFPRTMPSPWINILKDW